MKAWIAVILYALLIPLFLVLMLPLVLIGGMIAICEKVVNQLYNSEREFIEEVRRG